MISKTFVGVMSYLIIMQAVSGLFWDFLGFGGLFTICAIKGNCKGPHKRDTDGVKKVNKIKSNFFRNSILNGKVLL